MEQTIDPMVAEMLYQDKRYEEALGAYQIAHSLNPRDPVASQAVLKLKELTAQK